MLDEMYEKFMHLAFDWKLDVEELVLREREREREKACPVP